MDELLAFITVSGVLILGVINLILIPFSFAKFKKVSQRIPLGLFVLAAMAMWYFMGRAGIVADEQGIGGNQVPPFYGSEWYISIGIGVTSLFYQVLLWKRLKPGKRHDNHQG